MWRYVGFQPSFQQTLTSVVEKKTDKNCGEEEENFLDKIKEVLKGR